ncbi:MAG: hypothetical protein ACYSTG_11580 [Planctomycetota bacterium]
MNLLISATAIPAGRDAPFNLKVLRIEQASHSDKLFLLGRGKLLM